MGLILSAFWFFLPAGIANLTPVLANSVPLLKHWNTPIDLGFSWQGERILGDNKRVRGLVFGTIAAGCTALLLTRLSLSDLSFFNGCLMGLGALSGDVVESFLKRRRGIAPGTSWFPFDQIDYIIGGLVFVYLWVHPSIPTIIVASILYFVLHPLFSYLAYILRLRSKPF